MCLISRTLLTCFVLRFLFVLPSSIDVSFYLMHVVINIPLLLPRHSFIFFFFSPCIFDVMFGQGTAKTIKVGRIVGAPTTVCGRKSIVLLFHCSAVIVPLFHCLRVYLLVKYLLSGGLFSRHTRRQHTRLLFDSVGGVSIGRIVYINT